MGTEPAKRRYDSLHRTAQAHRTRGAIAEAARRLFTGRGWAATTVRAVAEEAGVSVPTVYAAYGDKTGLVRAVADAADLSAGVDRLVAALEAAEGDPAAQLAAMAGYDRRLYERAGEVIVLLREAGRTEPELATAYAEGRRRGDETRWQVFSGWPAGTLRPELDVPGAVDVYAALCTVDVYTTLTVERGWQPDRVERWWAAALARELLAPGR
ncbi:TetR/AcrR family transcriptional regulator [Streptomyces carpaticus]|uniref:Regulatory protein, tetR family n=3 Tax=Streptomyces TaxID=1883 RepID=A0A1I6PRZ1_9ACTN|nr:MULTISPECIES: TetR/AcrR family transcriptional regulator [Streptomyces]MCK1813479.1 TetR/AcrR family transcriptional regulator [Streptomyces sp. XM4011]QKV71385.1 TetR/AcrR family transcriptional regulator [Streptomyces harbinensis]UWM51831.1 TetR/AcrR family transcriptional regulator [Streptomyces carpaticus]SFS42984.1 regulatory protein, tetR family [Streptomyces harbinensis]